MRILNYCISTELGGAERSLLDLATNIKKSQKKIELEFLFPKNEGPLVDQLRGHGFKVSTLELPDKVLQLSRGNFIRQLPRLLISSPKLIRYLFDLAKFINSNNYDVIHTTGLKCHIFSGTIASLIDARILWHIRDIFSQTLAKTILKTLSSIHPIEMIFNSKASAEPFTSEGKVIYNGFTLSQPKKSYDLRSQLGLNEDVKLIVSVGVFARWKGQAEFIEIARQILTKAPNVHFLLVGGEIYDTTGEQGYTKELKSKVKKYQLDKSIHFLGFSKQVPEILSECDVFVHTSVKPEPFGRVIVEAMLSQVTVVAANAGGVKEIIQHQKTGWLCEPGNISDYCHAIESLLNDETKSLFLAQEAFQFAQTKFSMEAYVSQICDVYEMMRPFR